MGINELSGLNEIRRIDVSSDIQANVSSCIGDDIRIDFTNISDSNSDSFMHRGEADSFETFKSSEGELTVYRGSTGAVEQISEIKKDGQKIVQFYKGGILEKQNIINTDGSSEFTIYDSGKNIKSHTKNENDGSSISHSYENGKLKEAVYRDKNQNETFEEYNIRGILAKRVSGGIDGSINTEVYYDNGRLKSKYQKTPENAVKIFEYGQGGAKLSEKPQITAENKKLGINGKIDEFIEQGGTGDCWLISGINALNASEKGRQIIRHAIVPNPDGSITVNFDGAGKSYTITEYEINQYNTDDILYDSFSNGDNDMLALELAIAKLRKDDEAFKSISFDDVLNGGNPEDVWSALNPNAEIISISNNYTEKDIDEILHQAAKNKNSALCFGLDSAANTHKAELLDGSTFEWRTGPHSFAVSEITNDTITFINPDSSLVKYTMSISEFKKLAPADIVLADFSDA